MTLFRIGGRQIGQKSASSANLRHLAKIVSLGVAPTPDECPVFHLRTSYIGHIAVLSVKKGTFVNGREPTEPDKPGRRRTGPGQTSQADAKPDLARPANRADAEPDRARPTKPGADAEPDRP
jgi:hypothetical protein